MSESLKPCPKCGHEDVVGFVYGREGTFYGIEVRCECGLRFNADTMCDEEEEAWNAGVHMWNDRHERTCKPDWIEYGDWGICPICNGDIYFSDSYCTDCGAKIIKEDS